MQSPCSTEVFIVDESLPVRLRLARLLGGMQSVRVVGEASSANEAVEGILRSHPRLVFLELNLPGSTAIDVMRKVRESDADVIFAVLTNHSEPQYRDACLKAGARYFLDKSRDLDKVAAMLAEVRAEVH
jgi:Response regulator containing a CheY-like receiver domain and an HTH DNA-binding domain